MQKRDNVSFGTILYGKLRKMFAEKDSAGVIETAYEVMNSEEYKASEEQLRRIVMSKRGEGESVDTSNNAKNDKLKLAISYVLGYKEFEDKITKCFKPIQLRTEPNTAFYWSGTSNGIGGKDFALDFANQNGGITLEGLMKKQGIEMPIWDINDPVSINAWEYASAVYASQASGVVRAIIGKSTRKNSVWNKIEFEIMTNKTSDVTEIILIDPETLEKTTIFRR